MLENWSLRRGGHLREVVATRGSTVLRCYQLKTGSDSLPRKRSRSLLQVHSYLVIRRSFNFHFFSLFTAAESVQMKDKIALSFH